MREKRQVCERRKVYFDRLLTAGNVRDLVASRTGMAQQVE